MLVFLALISVSCFILHFYLKYKQKAAQNTLQPEKPKRQYELGFDVMLRNLKQVEIIPDAAAVKQKKKLANEIPEIKYAALTKSTKIENLANFVVIDIETTGIALTNKIIEVCAIKFEDFDVVDCFTTLINPERDIPEEVSAINHITNEMVKDAPKLHQIAEQLKDYVGNYPIVAHNAQFDIRHLFVRGIDLTENKVYDTLQLAQKIVSKKDVYNYKLVTLCEYYNLFLDDLHRATVDCLATGFLFESLCADKLEGYESEFLHSTFKEYDLPQDTEVEVIGKIVECKVEF